MSKAKKQVRPKFSWIYRYGYNEATSNYSVKINKIIKNINMVFDEERCGDCVNNFREVKKIINQLKKLVKVKQ